MGALERMHMQLAVEMHATSRRWVLKSSTGRTPAEDFLTRLWRKLKQSDVVARGFTQHPNSTRALQLHMEVS